MRLYRITLHSFDLDMKELATALDTNDRVNRLVLTVFKHRLPAFVRYEITKILYARQTHWSAPEGPSERQFDGNSMRKLMDQGATNHETVYAYALTGSGDVCHLCIHFQPNPHANPPTYPNVGLIVQIVNGPFLARPQHQQPYWISDRFRAYLNKKRRREAREAVLMIIRKKTMQTVAWDGTDDIVEV